MRPPSAHPPFLRPLTLIPAVLVAVLVWSGVPLIVSAQQVDGGIRIERPPEELESGSVAELATRFREGEHPIHIVLEGEGEAFDKASPNFEIPLRFGTQVQRNGETIGRSERDPMPFFPGDTLIGPEAWDFVPILFAATDREGLLPPGDYEVTLGAESVEGEASIRPATFGFTVPER